MKRCLPFLSFPILTAFCVAAAWAEPATPSTATVAAIAAAAPIPLPEITTQADSLGDSLRDQEAELAADKSTATISRELAVLSQELNPRLAEVSKMMVPGISLDMLRSQQRTWHQYEKELDDWKAELSKRATLLDQQIASFDRLEATWIATAADAKAEGAPPEVVQSADSVVLSLSQTRQKVERRRQDTLGLLVRMAQSDARVDRALGQLKRAREDAISRLSTRDGLPLWNADQHTRAEISQQSQTSIRTQVTALGIYARRRAARFVLHFLILVAFIVLLYAMRCSAAASKSFADLDVKSARILERPLDASILLSLLIVPWIYPQAPRLLWAVLGAAALIPTVLILRRLFDRQLHALLYAIVAFYFVGQVRSIMAALPFVARLIFAAEMAAGSLFLGWYVFIGPLAKQPVAAEDPFWRAMRIIARVALGVFVVSFLTNVFGYISLSTLLGNALLRSAYVAVFLYTVAKMLAAAILFALNISPLQALATVQNHRKLMARRLIQLVTAGGFYLWGMSTLEMLALRAPFFAGLRIILTSPLSIGSISLQLGNILAFCLTVWAAFLLSRFIRFLLEEDVFPRLALGHGLPFAISTMLHYVILLTGFLMAIAALGFDMTKFTILAGAFGVGVGFGTQNIINNFVSGLIVLFERPVKLGDVIQIADVTGRVEHIGIRATKIRTGSGSQVIVPNAALISERVTNWTGSNGLRTVVLTFDVPATGRDPQKVIETLKSLAASHPHVSKASVPEAYFVKEDGGAYVFELRLWTDEVGSLGSLKSDLAILFQNALAKLEPSALPTTATTPTVKS